MDTKGRGIRSGPVHKAAKSGAGLSDSQVGLAAWLVENFRAWSDCGATSNALLRLLKCKCHDMDEGGNQELGRFMQSSDIVRAFSERYQSSPAGMGRAILQRASLDRNASRRTFRRHGRAGV